MCDSSSATIVCTLVLTHTHTEHKHKHTNTHTHTHTDWNSSLCKAPYQQLALGFMIRFVADDSGSLIPREEDNRITKREMQFFVEHRGDYSPCSAQHSALSPSAEFVPEGFQRDFGTHLHSLQGRAASIYMCGITEWCPVCCLHKCPITMQCVCVLYLASLYSMALYPQSGANSLPPHRKSFFVYCDLFLDL